MTYEKTCPDGKAFFFLTFLGTLLFSCIPVLLGGMRLCRRGLLLDDEPKPFAPAELYAAHDEKYAQRNQHREHDYADEIHIPFFPFISGARSAVRCKQRTIVAKNRMADEKLKRHLRKLPSRRTPHCPRRP